MRRSQLQTKYFKTKSQSYYLLFRKQRNFVANFIKKKERGIMMD